MTKKPKHNTACGYQCAALPIKQEAGETFVLLVTSRESGRWVLPKGWAEKGLSGAQLAAKEAYEEAGVLGEATPKSVATYHYSKHLPKHRAIDCEVKVFPIRVTELLDQWPEAKQRRREWFTLAQAALAVHEGELVTMLLELALPR